jgi:twinkle protein
LDSTGIPRESHLTIEECLSHPIRSIPERKLSKNTCERFGVRIGVNTTDGQTPVYYLFPENRDGELSSFTKKNVNPKSYVSIGDGKGCEPFGYSLLPETGKLKRLYITEGPEDAMSIYQCLKENSSIDWEPNVIALRGAISKLNQLSEYCDKINKFEEIIIVLDNDPVGREASKKLCRMFPGKTYTIKLPYKDPNEMIVKGDSVKMYWALQTGAKKYQPDNIIKGIDSWDRYKAVRDIPSIHYPSTMPILNKKTCGFRPGSIVTITSGTGAGKTQFLRELKYHLSHCSNDKIADIALEEDVGDTVGGLISLHLNKRILLPDVNVPEEVEKRAFDDIFSSDQFTFYDHFGGMDDDSLFTQLYYFANSGHKFIFLDHLSIIISEFADEGDVNARQESIVTKLAKFVKSTGVTLFLVVHLRKSIHSNRSFENGAIPSIDDLKGASGLKQASFDIITLSRNQQHPDPICANTSQLHVLKCRLTGHTGTAGFLYFDDKTGRMLQSEEPNGYHNVR